MFEDIITTGLIPTTSSGTSMERNMLEKTNGKQDETQTQNTNTIPELNSNNLPPLWFKEYMEELKKDIVKEVLSEVTKSLLEILDKGAADSLHVNCPFKRHIQYTYNLRLEKKKHKKKRSTKEGKDGDVPTEYDQYRISRGIKSMKKKVKELQKVIDRSKEELLLMSLEGHRNCPHIQNTVNYLSRSNSKKEEEEEENTTDQNITKLMHVRNINVPSSQAQSSEQCNAHTKETESNIQNTTYHKDTELRMNCSLTAHQMLDKSCFKENRDCNESDTDKISICSDHVILDLNDDHNFEIIQVPSNCGASTPKSDACSTKAHEAKSENDSLSVASNDNPEDSDVSIEEISRSNQESASFELLSKTLSPTVSIYIDEDHFSACETVPTSDKNGNDRTTEPTLDRNDLYEDHFSANEDVVTSDDNGNDSANDTNPERSVLYIVDINGKVYKDYLPTESEKCVNLEKRPTGAYSFIGEALPVSAKETCRGTESVHLERRAKSACDLNTDVRTSHESYPTSTENVNTKRTDVPLAQRCYQSQSDMGEFGQSFHSHTTSMRSNETYITNEVHASTSYKYRQASCDRKPKMDAAQSDLQQACRKNKKEKWSKASRHEEEQYHRRTEKEKGSKVSRREEEQYNRRTEKEKGEKASRNEEEQCNRRIETGRCFGGHQGGNRGRTDAQRAASVALGSEVHILPESLVAGAAHVAFIAYDTALEVFERVRAHTVVFYEILPS